jgi:peptidoglycan/xylan/chitin deacetylase (PgdA/CDA1 family)
MTWTPLDSSHLRRRIRRHFLIEVHTAEKRVALSFDDGPSPRNTPPLLRVLQRHRVSATFFLLGLRARQFPALAAEIGAAGHEIGNHTDLHLPLPFLNSASIDREIRRGIESIESSTGVRPTYCRLPFGWYSERVLRSLRRQVQRPVLGNVYPRDSRRPGRDRIVQRVLDRIGPGAIVILHDGGWHAGVDRSQTVDAVDALIDRLGADGYRFQTVGALEAGV